jgi:hypothetical protein
VEDGTLRNNEALAQHREALSQQLLDAEASGKTTVVAELSGRLSALSEKLESATQEPDPALEEPTRPPSKVPEAIQTIIDEIKREPDIKREPVINAFKKAHEIYEEEVRELRTHKTKAASNIKSNSVMMRLKPQLTSLQLKIDHYAATVDQVFDQLVTLSEQLFNRKDDTNETRLPYIQLIEEAANKFRNEEDIASIHREIKRFEAQKVLLNTQPQLSAREEMYEGVIRNLETKIGGLKEQLDERERALASNGDTGSVSRSRYLQSSRGNVARPPPGAEALSSNGNTGSGISVAGPPPGADVVNENRLAIYGDGESKVNENRLTIYGSGAD